MGTTTNGASSQISIASADGYVRLPLSSLMALSFTRRVAWHDDDLLNELREENIPALEAGYCEWSTADAQQVSLGWAWFTVCAKGVTLLAPGGISSNVMLIDAKSRDMGANQTDSLLRAWLASVEWQPLRIAPDARGLRREIAA